MSYSVFEKARKNFGVVRKVRRDLSEAQYLQLLKIAKKFYVDKLVRFSKEDLKERYRVKSEFIKRLFEDLSLYEELVTSSVRYVEKEEKTVKKPSLQEHLERIRQNRVDEKTKSGEASRIKEGFVYIIENPVWIGWIKAGMTLDYEERLMSYNMYDPTALYVLVKMKWTADRKQSEDTLLENLIDHSQLQKVNGLR